MAKEKEAKSTINADGSEITVLSIGTGNDYISLTAVISPVILPINE
ncbi:hypothetical protein LL033_09920 [Clostridium estertheticum]|nr:hypothetical protein [Clostridium estertheticum]MBU3217786.1 hypothetical protein [Clostridium estertheticum]WAG57473.1 hypothetical protein LL033_09920 [Clostridium estertheticum]